jgi:ribonuclease R
MLAANRAVAEALAGAAQPAVYRNHEPPLPKDVDTLRETFARFGMTPESAGGKGGSRRDSAGGEAPSPAWVAAGLARVAGRPEERRIHQVVLRCMTRAQYGAVMRGHYALAFSHYTHFTSPIRRYADLVVHRALADTLEGRGQPERAPDAASRRQHAWMQRVAGQISWRERVAVDAEREMVDLQRCAFTSHHVGEVHPATVTGTARFGLWLTLDPWFVEGLVHVSSLSEFVDYDEAAFLFRARRSGERFALGDRFDVRIEAVDQIQARIDLRIVARLNS